MSKPIVSYKVTIRRIMNIQISLFHSNLKYVHPFNPPYTISVIHEYVLQICNRLHMTRSITHYFIAFTVSPLSVTKTGYLIPYSILVYSAHREKSLNQRKCAWMDKKTPVILNPIFYRYLPYIFLLNRH